LGTYLTNRIEAILFERGISKAQFYHDCGITSAAFSQWRTGKTYPRRSKIEFIARYFDVPPAYLTASPEEAREIILNDTLGKAGLAYDGTSANGLPMYAKDKKTPPGPRNEAEEALMEKLGQISPDDLPRVLSVLDGLSTNPEKTRSVLDLLPKVL